MPSSDTQPPRKRGGDGDRKREKKPRVERKPRDSAPTGEADVRALAEEHWPVSGAAPLDKEIVSSVYAKYLSRPARGRAATSCLVALELSGYLERYLWPHLAEPAAASWEHVMSIVALVNLKAREGAPAWAAFSAEPERFASLFSRVLDLPTEQPRWSSASYDA